LADLVRLARPSGSDDAGEANAIVDAACQAACEVARMDESLEVLQRSGHGHGRRSPEWNDAAAQCERARDALVHRLLEASASLARIHALHTTNMAATGPDLGELAAELCERAAREASARREIAALLG
jgi:hypothetical protein